MYKENLTYLTQKLMAQQELHDESNRRGRLFGPDLNFAYVNEEKLDSGFKNRSMEMNISRWGDCLAPGFATDTSLNEAS
jgi:hypothetical protein